MLKVAVMRVLMATPVTTGVRANGAVALTLGVRALCAGMPKMGSLLPPHAVISSVDNKARHHGTVPIQNLKVRIKELLSLCAQMPQMLVMAGVA